VPPRGFRLSGYFVSLLEQLHLHLVPPQFKLITERTLFLRRQMLPAASLPSTVNPRFASHVTGIFNFIAFFAILWSTTVLGIGIKNRPI